MVEPPRRFRVPTEARLNIGAAPKRVSKLYGCGIPVSSDGTAKTTTQEIWVVPHRGRWALQLRHGKRPFAVIGMKRATIEAGRALAKEKRRILVILDEWGGVESRETHRTPSPSATQR